jgi:tight adherence protein B
MSLVAIFAFFVVSFSVAGAVVFGAVIWTNRKRRAELALATAEGRTLNEESDGLGILKSDELSSIAIWHDLLTQFDFIDLLSTRLEQADLNWSVGRVTMAMLLLATVALAIVWQASWLPLWLALLVVPLAGLAPYFYIESKRKRRFDKFREHFPDALDSLSRALRSGSTVTGGLELVANEAEAPVSTEIRKAFVEANLGLPWERALDNLGKRVPLQEISIFVAALQIHSRTGGKLGEVMNRMAETMREQNAMQGEVRAISAHGKMTGMILTILPLCIAGMMMVVSPDYILLLVNHEWGKHMIAAAATCLVLAHIIIGRIVDIKA